MPALSTNRVGLGGLVLTDCRDGALVDLGRLTGVHALTLIRHRY